MALLQQATHHPQVITAIHLQRATHPRRLIPRLKAATHHHSQATPRRLAIRRRPVATRHLATRLRLAIRRSRVPLQRRAAITERRRSHRRRCQHRITAVPPRRLPTTTAGLLPTRTAPHRPQIHIAAVRGTPPQKHTETTAAGTTTTIREVVGGAIRHPTIAGTRTAARLRQPDPTRRATRRARIPITARLARPSTARLVVEALRRSTVRLVAVDTTGTAALHPRAAVRDMRLINEEVIGVRLYASAER